VGWSFVLTHLFVGTIVLLIVRIVVPLAVLLVSLFIRAPWLIVLVLLPVGIVYLLVPWLSPTPRGAPPPTLAGNMLLPQGQPIVASSHAILSATPTPTAGLRQWATAATAGSEYSNPEWSAMQAIGTPNTTSCGDRSTAWAPRSKGISPEWIGLDYATPVYATMLRVHETYNSGFIFQVDLKDTSGNLHTLWTGTDTTPCPGWFEIALPKTSFLVKGVKIHARISGWEEIDAVELIGEPVVQISTPITTVTPMQEPTPTPTIEPTAVLPPLNSKFFVMLPYYDPGGQATCHRRDTEQPYPCSSPGGQPPPTSSWVCTDANLKEYPCDPSRSDRSALTPPPYRSDLFIVQPYYDSEGQETCYNRSTGQPYPCNVPGDTPPPYRSDLFIVQPYYDSEGQDTCYRRDSGQPYSCTMPMSGDTPPPNYDPASSWVCTDANLKEYPCDPFRGITKP
jgi:hypothetical protein